MAIINFIPSKPKFFKLKTTNFNLYHILIKIKPV